MERGKARCGKCGSDKTHVFLRDSADVELECLQREISYHQVNHYICICAECEEEFLSQLH